MSLHDVLAYAIATEALARMNSGKNPWNSLFSASNYVTSSRVWPMPDFVLVDGINSLSIAAEFKPPKQTKREYLTGLGQAISYSRDFHYSLLVLPEIADDGYQIADHIVDIMQQSDFVNLPIGVLTYDPSIFSTHTPNFKEAKFFVPRAFAPTKLATLDNSFYAKWREMSPLEVFTLLSYSYDETRNPSSNIGTIRDRAFDKLWMDIQSGKILNWAGTIRRYSNVKKIKDGVGKNYRNFLFHIGWTESNGSLTKEGLEAHHVATLYGLGSRPALDAIAAATLTFGKHLILFNAISEYQDSIFGIFPNETNWLNSLEEFLENKGLLKRNIARGAAAVNGEERGFLKAEKQLWRQLGLIVPRGRYVFHPNRGFIFNWSRITDLLQVCP